MRNVPMSVPNLGRAGPSEGEKMLAQGLQQILSQLVMVSAQLDIMLKLQAGVLTAEEIQQGFADAQREGEEAARAAGTPNVE